MNNRPDDRTRLLAETLHSDWAMGPAAAMAQRAAAYARRRRAMRSVVTATTLATIVVALFFAARPPAPLPTTTVTAVTKPAYEIISDEEFLATMRDRPLLVLPQENGPKKFVLLDR